jgi:hypothetical protein
MTSEVLQKFKIVLMKRNILISDVNQIKTDTNKMSQMEVDVTNNDFIMKIECFIFHYEMKSTRKNQSE